MWGNCDWEWGGITGNKAIVIFDIDEALPPPQFLVFPSVSSVVSSLLSIFWPMHLGQVWLGSMETHPITS